MAIVGIGSRSSPIVIDDDDDDDGPSPPRAKSHSSSSSSVKEIPPQQSTRETTPARQEKPDQLKSGKGYSMLVRMGYKPGYGLGVNLEGMTSPIKAHLRPKKFTTAGLGVVFSRNGPSKGAPNAGPAPTDSQPSASVSEHAHKSASSSLPTKTSTIPRRRSSARRPNKGHSLNSRSDKSPHEGSSVLPGVDPEPTDGCMSTHADGTRKVNAIKTPMEQFLDSHQSTSPQDAGNTHPLYCQTSPTSLNFPIPFFFPDMSSVQSAPLHFLPPPVNFLDNAPMNIPLGSVNLTSRPILPSRPPSPQTFQAFGIPYVTRIKGRSVVVGMPVDDAKVGGTRGSFPKNLEPPPNSSCSLVMETLPRKFRTESFIIDWLSQFTFKPRRYELVEGKAFFEFGTEQDAQLAWKSPRMGGMEGLVSVRLFWYRVLPQTTQKGLDTVRKVNATRTIGNSAQPQLPPVHHSSTDDLRHHSGFKADLFHLHIPTQKAVSQPPSPPHSTVIEEDPGVPVKVNSPTESSRSNSGNQTSHGGGSTIPSPPVTTRASAASAAPSDSPTNRMDVDYAMQDLPSGGVPDLIPGATASPTVFSTSSFPTSSSALAPSSSRTPPSTLPTSLPEALNPAVTTTLVGHQAPPALKQGLLQASNSAAETSHMETEVQGIEFEEVDGTPLGADDIMDTTDAAALAKEQALREMVLRSRKRKLLDPSSAKQPTPATTTSGRALQDLATHFIADAIARPPPAKIVKITPSASAMAEYGKRLEQHVKSSKSIMARIQLTQSKVEKDRLMAILREKDRCIEKEKRVLYSRPVEEAVPVSPWPESHPDQVILVLSDTDDDDEGDYDSDDDME